MPLLKHTKALLLLIVALLYSYSSNSQQNKRIDSVRKLLSNVPADNKIKRAQYLIELGKLYDNESNYTSAMDCFQQSLALGQDVGNDLLAAKSYTNLGLIAYHQGDVKRDSIYSFTALDIYRKIHDKLDEGIELKSIGAGYLNQGKIALAKKYFDKALVILKPLYQQKQIAAIYSDFGIMAGGNYRQAIEWELAAKKIWDKYPADNALGLINVGNLGVAYFYMVRYDSLRHVTHDELIPADSNKDLKKADDYIRQAIKMAKQHNDAENAAYYTEILSELDYHNGNYKGAYDNFYYYQTVNDSIFSQQNKNKIAELENRNAMEKKNQELAVQKKYAQSQQRNIILLLVLLLALLIIGGLFYRLSVVRKQRNAELTKLNVELDKANKTKARFFAIITHDLRSPLSSLINFLNLQKNNAQLLSDEQKIQQEKRITTSATLLLGVMEEILLWSKGQMDNFKPEKTRVTVKDLFSYLESFFSSVSDVDLRFDTLEGLSIVTDENYMRTIMQNLTQNAVNALKQTPGPAIVWKAWNGTSYVKLSVTDNGPGMNAEQIKKFEENNTVSSAKQGLGLQLVKDMTQIIGCTISLSSSANTTTFVITVPAN